MSGVARLRQARKNHPMPTENVKQRDGRFGRADHIKNTLTVPTKSRPFGTEPNTKPPQGRALPVRGEAPKVKPSK